MAISAPFFTVYLLSDLQLDYMVFAVIQMASIVAQFVTLGMWGRISDAFGNRVVMVITCCIIPILPLLWLLSTDVWYLLLVQLLSGFAWSGFSLCSANYLCDLRPRHTQFATYAAVQSGITASAVFIGTLMGDYLAEAAHRWAEGLLAPLHLTSPLYVVFVVTTILRTAMAIWFLPNSIEPRIRKRPKTLEIVYRIARFNPVSGVVLDWLTVTPKSARKKPGELVDTPEDEA